MFKIRNRRNSHGDKSNNHLFSIYYIPSIPLYIHWLYHYNTYKVNNTINMWIIEQKLRGMSACSPIASQHIKGLRFHTKPVQFLSPRFNPNSSALLFRDSINVLAHLWWCLVQLWNIAKLIKDIDISAEILLISKYVIIFYFSILIYIKDYYYSIFKIMR